MIALISDHLFNLYLYSLIEIIASSKLIWQWTVSTRKLMTLTAR